MGQKNKKGIQMTKYLKSLFFEAKRRLILTRMTHGAIMSLVLASKKKY